MSEESPQSTGRPSGLEVADGFLTAWPTGTSQPVVSQLNLVGGEVVANGAIVPAGTNGAINVLVNICPTNLSVDINGYFFDTPGSPGNSLGLANNAPGGAKALFNWSYRAENQAFRQRSILTPPAPRHSVQQGGEP